MRILADAAHHEVRAGKGRGEAQSNRRSLTGPHLRSASAADFTVMVVARKRGAATDERLDCPRSP
jgi:hypothetical protein